MIPYPNPSTRDQARDNAVHLAKEAEDRIGVRPESALELVSLAEVWASIAATFPEDESQLSKRDQLSEEHPVIEDHRPYPASSDATEVIPRFDPYPDQVPVDRSLLMVLKCLAIRFVWDGKESMMSLPWSGIIDDNKGWDIKLIHREKQGMVNVQVVSKS